MPHANQRLVAPGREEHVPGTPADDRIGIVALALDRKRERTGELAIDHEARIAGVRPAVTPGIDASRREQPLRPGAGCVDDHPGTHVEPVARQSIANGDALDPIAASQEFLDGDVVRTLAPACRAASTKAQTRRVVLCICPSSKTAAPVSPGVRSTGTARGLPVATGTASRRSDGRDPGCRDCDPQTTGRKASCRRPGTVCRADPSRKSEPRSAAVRPDAGPAAASSRVPGRNFAVVQCPDAAGSGFPRAPS